MRKSILNNLYLFFIPTSGFNIPMLVSIRKRFSYLIPRRLNLGLLIFLSFFSCKTYLDVDKDYYKDSNEIFKQSEKLNFQIPLKINFIGSLFYNNKSYKVNGILKIYEYNKYQIFLNSRTLGIEVARIEFFADSIFFINKITKFSIKDKIANVPYLRGLHLSSEEILRILTGRGFSGIVYSNISNTNKFKYNYYSYTGYVDFNNFGFLKSHFVNIGTSKINIFYEDYYRKYKLPYNINCELFTSNLTSKFNFKYTSINTLDKEYKHLFIPTKQ